MHGIESSEDSLSVGNKLLLKTVNGFIVTKSNTLSFFIYIDEHSLIAKWTGDELEKQSHLEHLRLILATLLVGITSLERFVFIKVSSSLIWDLLGMFIITNIFRILASAFSASFHMIVIEVKAHGFGNWLILDRGLQFCFLVHTDSDETNWIMV